MTRANPPRSRSHPRPYAVVCAALAVSPAGAPARDERLREVAYGAGRCAPLD